jgi:hypothetical protein
MFYRKDAIVPVKGRRRTGEDAKEVKGAGRNNSSAVGVVHAIDLSRCSKESPSI